MSRLQSRFETLRDAGRKALVTFITAGDPHPDLSVHLMHTLAGAGADVIELGVPFSDPMADGPVIQRASERALSAGTRLAVVLDIVRRFREHDPGTPVVLMGYVNPFERMGYRRLASRAAEVGVDGVLSVDLPPEEAEEPLAALHSEGIDSIFLLAPTSTPERIARVAAVASGFLYYVSLKGVTGAAHLDTDEVARQVARIRPYTSLPIAVGFGIADAAAAARVARISDAVVVGSALVERVARRGADAARLNAEIATLVSSMRAAMDEAGGA